MPATTIKTDKPLTWMQEAFCQAYVGQALGNGTKAAGLAGYKGNDNTLATVAKQNTRKYHLKARIEALQANQRSETDDEREKTLKTFADIRDNPKANNRDRIQAGLGIGKMCGWLSETHILETKDRQIQLDEAQRAIASRAALVLHDTKRLPDGSYGTDPPITCDVVGE